MSQVTEPILLNSTGERIATAIESLQLNKERIRDASVSGQTLTLTKVPSSGTETTITYKPQDATESVAGLITEAPSDGKQYARKDGAWTEVTGGSGTITDVKVNSTSVVSGGVATITVGEASSNNIHLGSFGITATKEEINALHSTSGASITSADIEKLQAIDASATEINILHGVTASTAELNILDGVKVSTTEINYLKGVKADVQTQINERVTKPSSYTEGSLLYLKNDGSTVAVAPPTATTPQVLTWNGSTYEWVDMVTTN